MNLRFVKLFFVYLIVGVLFFTVSAPSVSAQACGSAVTVDRFLCTQVLDGGGNIISCQPNYTRQTNVPCNTSTCMTTSDVCSSNDISKCTPQNGCSPLPCSPASCGTGGSTPGSCPAECRQGASCGVGYSGATGCSGSGVSGGCTANQTCCKANFCSGNGGTCGFEQVNCPAGYVTNTTVSGTQCRPKYDNTCAGLGNAQSDTGVCCHSTKTEPSVCGDWYSCPTPSNPSKVCRDCTPEVWECDSYTINTYQCVSTAPVCSPTSPAAQGVTNPGIEAVSVSTNPLFQWPANSNWGNKCPAPNANAYKLYVQQCAPTGVVATPSIASLVYQTPNPSIAIPSVTQYSGWTGTRGNSYCWRVEATNGGQSVFSTPRRFSIPNDVTGTVYRDDTNQCLTSTPWNGVTTPVSVLLSGGASDGVNSVGAYNIPVPDALNNHTLSTTLPGGYICSTGCAGSCLKTNVGVSNLGPHNFFLTSAREAWWQVEGAPVYGGAQSGTTIRSELPTASTRLILPGAGWTSGALLRAGGISPDLGTGAVSDDLWNTIARYRGKKMDYAYFAANMGLLSTTPQLNNTGAKPATGADFYYKASDYNITSVWSVANNESYVVFVDGDLNVNSNITVAPGGFLAFIVSGDIIVAPSVTRAEGIFLSSGSFITNTVDPTHTIDDVALNIAGSVIAWGSVDFNRDMNSLNLTTPAEKVSYRTDLLENMPDNMKIFAMEWSEVVSGTLDD